MKHKQKVKPEAPQQPSRLSSSSPTETAHRTTLFNPEYIKSYEHVHQTAAYS